MSSLADRRRTIFQHVMSLLDTVLRDAIQATRFFDLDCLNSTAETPDMKKVFRYITAGLTSLMAVPPRPHMHSDHIPSSLVSDRILMLSLTLPSSRPASLAAETQLSTSSRELWQRRVSLLRPCCSSRGMVSVQIVGLRRRVKPLHRKSLESTLDDARCSARLAPRRRAFRREHVGSSFVIPRKWVQK